MGGTGSTRWRQHSPRRVADYCLSISIFRLRQLQPEAFAQHLPIRRCLTWHNGEGKAIGVVDYALSWEPSPTLTITVPQGKRTVIKLTSTRCNYGGERWWCACPSCGRRVGRLYLLGFIACRHCHDLTYQSAQEAHGFAPSVFLHRVKRLEVAFKRHKRGKKKLKAWRRLMAVSSVARGNGF